MIIGICALLVLFLFGLFSKKKENNTLLGSAMFDKKSKALKWYNKGFYIARCKKLSVSESLRHLLVIGGTGSYKSQIFVSKNFLHLSKHFSLICTDPKGELLSLSGIAKKKHSSRVFVINLIESFKSACFNPFHSTSITNAQAMATRLYNIVQTKHVSESFWKHNTISFMASVIKVLCNYKKRKYLNFRNLKFVFDSIVSNDSNVQEWLMSYAPNKETKRELQSLFNMDEKIKSGILSGCIATLAPYCIPEILKISNKTTIPKSINFFRENKAILIVSTPAGEETHKPFISLLFSSYFKEILKNPLGKKNEREIFFINEEAGSYKLENWSTILSLVRQKKLGVLSVLQSMNQYADLYGHNSAENIVSNHNSLVILPGVKNRNTLGYISENLLGRETIEIEENGRKRLVSKNLMSRDEIMRLKDFTALFINGNSNPVILKRLRPLYKSLLMKIRYKLKSVNKNLVSKYKPVEHNRREDSIELISFDESESINQQDKEFEEMLNKVFKSDDVK